MARENSYYLPLMRPQDLAKLKHTGFVNMWDFKKSLQTLAKGKEPLFRTKMREMLRGMLKYANPEDAKIPLAYEEYFDSVEDHLQWYYEW